ncbi:MAG: MmgE/PrpD family protein [Deltaproteobacteria bacterium]|nr:MAG: MmgE/PrpD family protein [Deltaproteobacteria bacterium]
MSHPTRELCEFLSAFGWNDIPPPVIETTKGLFLDWFASALAGKDSRPVRAFQAFAKQAGPATGPSEVLVDRGSTSPFFAALVNAASSHVVEQDDVHNGAVFHPGTVVFSAVLALAQAEKKSGKELLLAAIAGYETGIRVGEFLGRSHYTVFHTTGTAGTLASAAATAKLLGFDADRTQQALGSAGTQAAGLWEFLRDAADSKQLHTAKAAADGLLATCLAREGMTGAKRILEGPQGMAAGMSRDADPQRITDRLGRRWALAETSYKWHASCRHTHPAADALLDLLRRERLGHEQVAQVTARVHQAAIDVLGPVVHPQSVHAFRERVRMVRDDEVEAAYPQRWIGKVEVRTTDGHTLTARVDVPKGDPGNPLSRSELEAKAIRLARFRGGATEAEMRAAIECIWRFEEQAQVGRLLA